MGKKPWEFVHSIMGIMSKAAMVAGQFLMESFQVSFFPISSSVATLDLPQNFPPQILILASRHQQPTCGLSVGTLQLGQFVLHTFGVLRSICAVTGFCKVKCQMSTGLSRVSWATRKSVKCSKYFGKLRWHARPQGDSFF